MLEKEQYQQLVKDLREKEYAIAWTEDPEEKKKLIKECIELKKIFIQEFEIYGTEGLDDEDKEFVESMPHFQKVKAGSSGRFLKER